MDTKTNNQPENLTTLLNSSDQRIAALVHELKSPLTVILLGLSALDQAALSERDRLRLNLAMDEALRLRRMLKESWLSTKYAQSHQQPLDLHALLTEVLQLMCVFPIATKHRLRLRTNFSTVWIVGDRDHLKQVFINLITNACEATLPGEEIICYLGVNDTSSQAYVTVRNWGEPISPERLPQLTQPFVSSKSNGTGLGLAIVKQIVENHRGHLHLASSHDLGTRVTVQLPKPSQLVSKSMDPVRKIA